MWGVETLLDSNASKIDAIHPETPSCCSVLDRTCFAREYVFSNSPDSLRNLPRLLSSSELVSGTTEFRFYIKESRELRRLSLRFGFERCFGSVLRVTQTCCQLLGTRPCQPSVAVVVEGSSFQKHRFRICFQFSVYCRCISNELRDDVKRISGPGPWAGAGRNDNLVSATWHYVSDPVITHDMVAQPCSGCS